MFMRFGVCRLFLKSSFSKFFHDYNHSVKQFVSSHFVGPDMGPNCLKGYKQTTLVDKDLKKAWFSER